MFIIQIRSDTFNQHFIKNVQINPSNYIFNEHFTYHFLNTTQLKLLPCKNTNKR